MLYMIKNWHEYQHYKNRNPPWVKLHVTMLSSQDWVTASDATRVLAIACMIVASKSDGVIDGSPTGLRYLERVAYLNQPADLGPLVESSFLISAEAEAEAEAEKRQRQRQRREETDPLAPSASTALASASTALAPSASTALAPAGNVAAVVEHYQSHKPRSHPGDKERKLIRARLKDGYTVEDLCTAIDGCMASPWHQGKNDSGRAYQKLELIMRDASKVDQFIALADPQARDLQLMNETSRHAVALAASMEDF